MEPSQLREQPLISGFTLTEVANVFIQVTGVIIAAVFGAWAVKSYESANFANQLSEESLSQSKDGLKQTLYANILAIINLCDQFRNSTDCPAMLQDALFASIIRGVIPTLSTISSSTQIRSTSTLTRDTLPTLSTILINSQIHSTRKFTYTAYTSLPTSTPSPPSAVTPSPTPTTSSTLMTRTTVVTGPTGTGYRSSPQVQITFGAIVGIIVAVVVTVAIFCLLLIWLYRRRRFRAYGDRVSGVPMMAEATDDASILQSSPAQ